MSTDLKKLKVLTIGITPLAESMLKAALPECEVISRPYDESLLMDTFPNKLSLIVCGDPKLDMKASEVAQSLRMLYARVANSFHHRSS